MRVIALMDCQWIASSVSRKDAFKKTAKSAQDRVNSRNVMQPRLPLPYFLSSALKPVHIL